MLTITAAQRRELRGIADDAPRAIRARLLAVLNEIGRGHATSLEAFVEVAA
ncbi:MAG: hypothetical protein QOI63_985 [Thermoplasmata archaeon]|jgi:hypothetical protein|nr:hypothetical protein [Thermoplasmata archaeon]